VDAKTLALEITLFHKSLTIDDKSFIRDRLAILDLDYNNLLNFKSNYSLRAIKDININKLIKMFRFDKLTSLSNNTTLCKGDDTSKGNAYAYPTLTLTTFIITRLGLVDIRR
jgi:hypothetical protein